MQRSRRLQIRVLTLSFLSATFGVLVAAGNAGATQEVGTVANVDGAAHVQRGGESIAAAIGNPIYLGDQLVTGRPGRMKIVFQDDSVLTVSEDSRVTVDQQVFEPDEGKAQSLFGVLQGKVSAVVSEYYHRQGNAYEIKTVTAVAGVRGTEFSVSYDPSADATEILGIEGVVNVRSLRDPEGAGVIITANEVTTVPRGQLPSAPRRMNERLFRERTEGFDFVGRGRAESLANASSISMGARVVQMASQGIVTPGSPPGLEPGAVRNVGAQGDATKLIGQPPSFVRSTGQLGIEF